MDSFMRFRPRHGGSPPVGYSWWSRIRPLKKCAIRTIAVVAACIVASAPIRSSTKNLRQIAASSSRGAQVVVESKKSECPTLRAEVIPDEGIADVCSPATREGRHDRWRGDLDRHFSGTIAPAFAVVLTVNSGYHDFFVNWHRHFLRANTDPANRVLIIIAEDASVHDRLVALFDHPATTTTTATGGGPTTTPTIVLPGYDASNDRAHRNAEDYDSFTYKSLVSTRATHLLNLICSLRGPEESLVGANEAIIANEDSKRDIIIVYSDVDTVWLKDPLPYIQAAMMIGDESAPYDLLAAVDDRDYWCVEDYYCTGFLVIAQSPASISFLSHWEKELIYAPQLNQPVFNTVLRSPGLPKIRHGGLGEVEFPPGRLYFDQWSKEGGGGELGRRKKAKTVVVHNNYIIGHDAKRKRFEEHGLWIKKNKKQ